MQNLKGTFFIFLFKMDYWGDFVNLKATRLNNELNSGSKIYMCFLLLRYSLTMGVKILVLGRINSFLWDGQLL